MSCCIPPTAAEYCLLWIDWWPLCMTKAEWAAWASGVGALLAIAWAWHQARRHERKVAADAARKALKFASSVRSVVRELSAAASAQDWTAFEVGREDLDKELNLAMAVPDGYMSDQAAVAFQALQSKARVCLKLAQQADAGTLSPAMSQRFSSAELDMDTPAHWLGEYLGRLPNRR